jgi:4,5:9,10-diseco-3-hydroxy-5,9,17-trioxoandrosta-1(10),2-diene-4-oate hydrolase
MVDRKTPESHFTGTDGSRVHYHEFGQGEPIIMIHGGGPGATGISNYRKNASELAKHFKVYVIDLPGYGQSDNNIGDTGIFESLANSVIAFMDELGIGKASFVGNSLGGGTSLKIAVKRPERVGKLVLMGTGGSMAMFTPMPTEGLQRMLGFYNGEPTMEKLKRVIDLLVFDPSTITTEILEERLAASKDPKTLAKPPLSKRGHLSDEIWREPLSQLPHETLLIWGREDRVVPLDSAFILLKTIPNARLHVFPKCGHWAQWEKADSFNTLVTGFLKSGV